MDEQVVKFVGMWKKNDALFLRHELAELRQPREMTFDISGVTVIARDLQTGAQFCFDLREAFQVLVNHMEENIVESPT